MIAADPPGRLCNGQAMHQCIVLKKVYTFWLLILIVGYKFKFILKTIYTSLYSQTWKKRQQALTLDAFGMMGWLLLIGFMLKC